MADERPGVYEEDGRVIYRASAIGGCLVALAAARQGYESKGYPERALEVFEAGQNAEDWFFNEHPHKGQQAELELPITGRIIVRAHCDALNKKYGIEVKSQTGEMFKEWTPDWFDTDPMWIKYSWQISVMMLATGLDWRVVRINRDDLSDYGVAYFMVEKPFHTLDEIRARVFEAEILAREADLKCAHGDFFCPYPYLHTDVDITDDPVLDEQASMYLAARNVLEEQQKAVAHFKEKIIELLGGRPKVRLMSGTNITLSEMDVPEHVVKASHQTRLSVRRPK